MMNWPWCLKKWKAGLQKKIHEVHGSGSYLVNACLRVLPDFTLVSGSYARYNEPWFGKVRLVEQLHCM